jgi:hypothetical protein
MIMIKYFLEKIRYFLAGLLAIGMFAIIAININLVTNSVAKSFLTLAKIEKAMADGENGEGEKKKGKWQVVAERLVATVKDPFTGKKYNRYQTKRKFMCDPTLMFEYTYEACGSKAEGTIERLCN